MSSAAILLAAGSSRRMRSVQSQNEVDKMLIELAGKPLFLHAFENFVSSEQFDLIVITYRDIAQLNQFKRVIESKNNFSCDVIWVQGGVDRQNSVFHGLASIPKTIEWVYIHDCARPLIAKDVLKCLDKKVRVSGAVTLAHRVRDTIKWVESTDNSFCGEITCIKDLDRNHLWATETPQVFRREWIQDGYRYVIERDLKITDDVSAVTALGHSVELLENPHLNLKVTTQEDIDYLNWYFKEKKLH